MSGTKKRISTLTTKLSKGGTLFLVLLICSSIFGTNLSAQENAIKGNVTDTTKEPLPGVTIYNSTSGKGALTNFDGNYTIKAKKGDILVFSFVGMEKQSITIEGATTINVSLKDTNSLDEVIVVGYGTQKKVNLTGAVSSVNIEKDLGERSTANITSMLQGVLPGLTLGYGNGGGEPGSSQSLTIRGTGTLTGNGGTPYILVDGFPTSAGELNAINPDDIEDVSILKDAASAAIYGSKGAFGVILITTKKGRENTKPQFVYSTNYQLSSNTVKPKMANSMGFATAYNQAQTNSGQTPWFDSAELETIQDYLDGKIPHETALNDRGNRWLSGGSGYANNDWYDIFFKDHATRTKHNFSLRGGEKKTTYFISSSLFQQEGQLRYGNNTYDRFNINVNINTKITDWMKFEVSVRQAKERKDYPSGGFGSFTSSIIYHQMSRQFPTNIFKTPDGSIFDPNVLRLQKSGDTYNDIHTNNIQFAATLEPLKDWETRISYSKKTKSNVTERERFRNIRVHPDGFQQNVGYPNDNIQRIAGTNQEELINLVSSYKKSSNGHNFNALVGYEQRNSQFVNVVASRSELLSKEIPAISTAIGEQLAGDSLGEQATQGAFARLAYNFQEKYLIEFNGRADGSSFFPEGNKWGYFPSVSLGYNISKEDFFEPLTNVINRLKIRASYGQLGNHDFRLSTRWQPILPKGTTSWLINGQQPNWVGNSSILSPSLTWETVTTKNIAFDAGLFSNKLDATFELFERETSDMIGPSNVLPAVLGDSAPQVNNGTLTTSGFELNLKWKDKIGDFSYNIGFNIVDSKSKVTKYNNPLGLLNRFRTGQTLGDFWGYETVGFFKTDEDAAAAPSQSIFRNRWLAGDVQYADLNGSGDIDNGENTEANPGDRKILGNNRARYNYGISMGANYKGIGISLLFQGVAKRDWLFSQSTNLFYGFRGNIWQNSVTEASLDYWTPETPNAYFPKPYINNEHLKNTRDQSKYIQNAAYLRLKNIQISYNIPKKLLEKIGLTNLQFYITGENLLTFTKLNKNFDPETLNVGGWGNGKVYPPSKVISTGMKLTF